MKIQDGNLAKLPAWFPSYEYRIKPQKKSPGQVFWEAREKDTGTYHPWSPIYIGINNWAIEVIEAYKRGEIDYP